MNQSITQEAHNLLSLARDHEAGIQADELRELIPALADVTGTALEEEVLATLPEWFRLLCSAATQPDGSVCWEVVRDALALNLVGRLNHAQVFPSEALKACLLESFPADQAAVFTAWHLAKALGVGLYDFAASFWEGMNAATEPSTSFLQGSN